MNLSERVVNMVFPEETLHLIAGLLATSLVCATVI